MRNLSKITLKFYFTLSKYSTLGNNYQKYYKILNIGEESTQEEIKAAYIKLAKIYHPDSGNEKASADKFYEIDEAFKLLYKRSNSSTENENLDLVKEQDIKHTAPQHRQYLSFDGVGFGNPYEREKQYTKHRAVKASQNVFKHRVEKATADEHALIKKKSLKHDIKTKYGLDRLVEDLIQESMSKGEFTKLSGAGKPLKEKHNRNPYVDFVTHKLNEVLIDNGFTPEWITLHKEIRQDLKSLRNKLREERSLFNSFPLNEEEKLKWMDLFMKYQCFEKDIYLKINKFNLIVPILTKQLFHINLREEGNKIIREKPISNLQAEYKVKDHYFTDVQSSKNSLFSFIEKLFK